MSLKLKSTRVEGLKKNLGYDNLFAVSSSGRSGGLGIVWNNEINLVLLPYSQYHIDAIVTEGSNDPWRLTCVYGEAQTNKRHKTWDMLKFIKSSSHLPWVCVGDFNEVLHQTEHVGVNDRSFSQIASFREMVDVCGFHDLGFKGRSWTFEKKIAGGSFCRVHLDRALATPDWSSRIQTVSVHHLSAAASDHIPILLQWHRKRAQRWRKGRFRYEVMLETHAEFSVITNMER